MGHRPYDPHHIERLQELKGSPLATFWRRGIAFGIDCFTALLLLMIVLVSCSLLIGNLRYIGNGTLEGTLAFTGEVWGTVVEFFLPITYFGLITYFANGKTVGKWITGIRVVSITHKKLSLYHSAERAMAYATSILEFGFGFFQYFINHNHQTLGNRIAETIVIRDGKRFKRRLLARTATPIDKEEEATFESVA